jgi:hypothetical protein
VAPHRLRLALLAPRAEAQLERRVAVALISYFSPPWSSPLRSAAMENRNSISGTRLMHTAMFTARSRPRSWSALELAAS